MFKLYNFGIIIMEDYVLIDSVLQALHMSKFSKKPKHLKKYQLNTTTFYSPKQKNLISIDPLNISKTYGRFSIKPINNSISTEALTNNLTEKSERNKIKMKFILQQDQRIPDDDKRQTNKQNFQEFFTKRVIQPKSTREHCIRTCTLVRTPETVKGFFYDANIQTIRKKSRKCIILPERKRRLSTDKTKKSTYQKVNLKQLVKQQWQQQRKKRKAQCKTTTCSTRQKNQMLKQAKKYQQQLRGKDSEQKSYKPNSEKYNSNRLFLCQQVNKATLPLTKDQIRSKASDIMHKYGIDSARCCFKLLAG